MQGFIYLIHNKVSNKGYVGQTLQKNPSKRWNQHKYDEHNSHLRSSMKKYGIDSFEFSVLEKIEAENKDVLKSLVYESEIFWIDNFKFMGLPLYNQRPASMSNKGVKRGSPWNKGIPMSDKQKDILLRVNTGKKHTDEHKKRISESNKGKESWSKGKKRGPLSEETKTKLSELKKGKPFSEEHRKNLSLAHKGQTPSEEARKNMSEAQIKRQKLLKEAPPC